MFYTLATPIVTLVAIVLGWFPDFTNWFQLVEFEGEYRINVIKVVVMMMMIMMVMMMMMMIEDDDDDD